MLKGTPKQNNPTLAQKQTKHWKTKGLALITETRVVALTFHES